MAGRAIEMVQTGMKVVDATGRELGEVEWVELGEPGGEVPDDSLGDVFREGVAALNDHAGEPQLPEPVRTRFRQHGFFKVDGPGLLDTDRYVRADWIAQVASDRVHLTHAWDQLPREV
jgi:hypothetical protein